MGLSVFIYALFLWREDTFLSILASLAMLLILAIYFSSTFRVFLYKIYLKIKKGLLYPKGRDVKL